jgi:enediyne biosynthesis thioesterase
MRYFEYRHLVTFQETNLVGNVYYTHHLNWQGRCRELFLHEHAPEIITELEGRLSLATVRCSCEYFAELTAFDEVILRMRLIELAQSRITLGFDYFRAHNGSEELVARGEQQIACMMKENGRLTPTNVPAPLHQALIPYS